MHATAGRTRRAQPAAPNPMPHMRDPRFPARDSPPGTTRAQLPSFPPERMPHAGARRGRGGVPAFGREPRTGLRGLLEDAMLLGELIAVEDLVVGPYSGPRDVPLRLQSLALRPPLVDRNGAQERRADERPHHGRAFAVVRREIGRSAAVLGERALEDGVELRLARR